MNQVVSRAIEDKIAILTIENAPANLLTREVRQALLDHLIWAQTASEVVAVIIRAQGAGFSSGAEMAELDGVPETPTLAEVCDAIESSTKPVIAALHGSVLAGGVELAIAAHGRIALRRTHMGMPEITLGSVPSAGGTQRLPRLVGPRPALALMLGGKTIVARRALKIGAIDRLAQADLLPEAVKFAHDLSEKPLVPTRDRRDLLKDGRAFQSAALEARERYASFPTRAASRLIDCVEAAPLLPFDAGVALEQEAFLELTASDEARALRYLYVAETRAMQLRPDLPNPMTLRKIGVVGGGDLAAHIVSICLSANLPVVLCEASHEAAQAAQNRVAKQISAAVERRQLTSEEAKNALGRLELTSEHPALRACDLVIEAVNDDEVTKTRLMTALSGALDPNGIVATTTSHLDINLLARAFGRPARVLGLHFQTLVQSTRLLEVIPNIATSAQVEATGFGFAGMISRVPIWSGLGEGYIATRIQDAYCSAAEFLMEDGASPYEIDAAMVSYGFALGPFQVQDLTGLDLGWARRKTGQAQRDPNDRYVRIADLLCQQGRFGRKSGAGYYRYEDAGRAGPDPEVTALIAAEREAKGIEPRRFSAQQIRSILLMAMVNEGAALLDEGQALNAADIDLACVLGIGFPRHRGGPMKAAEFGGLLKLHKGLTALAKDNSFWTPSPRIKAAAIAGNRFSEG